MKKQLINLLKQQILELAHVEITSSLQLIAGGYMDSFDIINLISAIESEFGIILPVEEINLEDFDSIDSIINIIMIYQGKKNGS